MKTDFELLLGHYKKIKEIFNESTGFQSIGYYFWLLMFLKRYSDIFNEEVENIIKTDKVPKTAAQFLCLHTKITLPEEARWEEISATEKNIGEKIKSALKLIEDYNSDFGKTLSSIIPIWPQDMVLRDIILEFNEINLSNQNLEIPSQIVDFYNYLKENEDGNVYDVRFEKVLSKVW